MCMGRNLVGNLELTGFVPLKIGTTLMQRPLYKNQNSMILKGEFMLGQVLE